MTPKDKAKDLITDFYDIKAESPDYSMEWQMAKKCALIAVEELIDSHLLLTTTHDSEPSIRCKRYWKEVEKELIQL